MKKIIASLLALGMMLTLCACGNAETATVTQPPVEERVEVSETTSVETTETVPTEPQKVGLKNWFVDATVDEFGDITENSQIAIKAGITGDFSNTATAGSDLRGIAYFVPDNEALITLSFRLFEYKDNPASYTNSDIEEATFKIKVGDQVMEYPITGTAPTGDFQVLLNNGTPQEFRPISNFLIHDMDVRCILYLGSSQYNFTLESDGFLEACIEAGYLTEDWISGKNAQSNAGKLDYVYDWHFLDYIYDNQGRIAKTVSANPYEGTTVYSYDENGKLATSTTNKDWMNSGSGYTCIDETEYNEYGDPITKTTTYHAPEKNTQHEDGDVIVTTYEYEYNADGTKATEKIYHDGEMRANWYSYSYAYDSNGNLAKLEATSHTPGTDDTFLNTTIYIYDANGNLVKSERSNSYKTFDPVIYHYLGN